MSKKIYYVVSIWDTMNYTRTYEGYTTNYGIACRYVDQAGDMFPDGTRRVILKLSEPAFEKLNEKHAMNPFYMIKDGTVLTPDIEDQIANFVDYEIDYIEDGVQDLLKHLKLFKGQDVKKVREALKEFDEFIITSSLFDNVNVHKVAKCLDDGHDDIDETRDNEDHEQ